MRSLHQGGADKHGVGAGLYHSVPVGWRVDSRLRHSHDVTWNVGEQGFGTRKVDIHGLEVSAVHTDDWGLDVQCDGQLTGSVNLHKRVHAKAGSFASQGLEGFDGQHGDDEKHGIGTGGSGLVNLNGVQKEVLSEQGEIYAASDGFQVVDVPA